MSPPVSPERVCLPLQLWPSADRQLWRNALQAGDVLEPGGVRSHYAAVSNRKVERGYGRWLTFCRRRNEPVEELPPAGRITREHVAAYIGELERLGNGTQTVLARLQELYEAALVMDPLRDWQWIRRMAGCVRARHVPARDKRPRIVGNDELLGLGLALMARAPDERTNRRRAITYRDGLLIAILALRPILRRRNITTLELDRHVVQSGEVWMVHLAECETKTRVPLDFPWPETLVPALEDYIARWRPTLLAMKGRWNRPAGNALWISSDGSPMTQQAIYERIVERTRIAFGRPINPHLFRDCAASTLADEDPEHVRAAAPLLGHSTFSTTERYYLQANQVTASRAYQQEILRLRAEYPGLSRAE